MSRARQGSLLRPLREATGRSGDISGPVQPPCGMQPPSLGQDGCRASPRPCVRARSGAASGSDLRPDLPRGASLLAATRPAWRAGRLSPAAMRGARPLVAQASPAPPRPGSRAPGATACARRRGNRCRCDMGGVAWGQGLTPARARGARCSPSPGLPAHGASIAPRRRPWCGDAEASPGPGAGAVRAGAAAGQGAGECQSTPSGPRAGHRAGFARCRHTLASEGRIAGPGLRRCGEDGRAAARIGRPDLARAQGLAGGEERFWRDRGSRPDPARAQGLATPRRGLPGKGAGNDRGRGNGSGTTGAGSGHGARPAATAEGTGVAGSPSAAAASSGSSRSSA